MSDYQEDRKKIEELRQAGLNIGHRDGTPFNTASLYVYDIPDIRHLNLAFILDVVNDLQQKAVTVQAGLDEFNNAEQFAYHFVKTTGILSSLELYYQRNDDGDE